MKLSTRERVWVGAGGAFVVGLAFWLGVYEPLRGHIELLGRQVQARQAEYRELGELAARYRDLSASALEVEERLRRAKGFSILSHLEKLALENNLRRKIPQMRAKGGETTRHYRENTIEVKMEGVRLSELVKFLFRIEHPEPRENVPDLLRIKELRVRPNPQDKNLLDAMLQVSAYELLESV